ncbi:MAG: ATP-binding cassette domain-containing protein [Candidatus Dormibacteraeota bacterium]|nr:ATP-binding cassette domain-containing protein [Candidatus Dormibacteraeota bacterium]
MTDTIAVGAAIGAAGAVATGAVAIQTRALRRTFEARSGPVEAVAGVDLEVRTGEIFGFLGPNGAGKTTTLRMLSTLLPPTSGEAMVAGADLLTEAALVRRRIGYVGQIGGSDLLETGRNELVFQGRLHGMSAAASRQRATELLASLEIESCADRKTATYSGGQRRRLDIAIGLMHSPQLVFLDEPTTGLDPQARAHLWVEVRRLREHGTTVFLTTHYLEEADALCDRLAIIDHGRIVAEGTPDQLKRQVAGDAITLSLTQPSDTALDQLRSLPFVREASAEDGRIRLYVDRGETAMPALLRALDAADLQMATLTIARPSLDDVFLAKTGRSLRESTSA